MSVLDSAARLISSRPSIEGGTSGCYKDFNLIEIPDVMKAAGRNVGAELMTRWFRNPGYTIPENWKTGKFETSKIPGFLLDTSIVKMRWVLSFERARLPFRELKNIVYGHGDYNSLKRTKVELFDSLKLGNNFQSYPTNFGETKGKVNILDIHQTAHLNFRRVSTQILEKALEPLDDLYCGLGAFAAHMAASGTVVPIKGNKSGRATHQVTIQKLGYYIRDSYDFNEDQPLGFWGAGKFSKFPGNGLFAVDNEIFRNWRIKHGRGCDFIIFSDILWEPAPSGLIWEYPY